MAANRRRGSAPRDRYSGHGGADLKDERAAVVTDYSSVGIETLSDGADAEEIGPARDQQVMISSIIAKRPTDHR